MISKTLQVTLQIDHIVSQDVMNLLAKGRNAIVRVKSRKDVLISYKMVKKKPKPKRDMKMVVALVKFDKLQRVSL